MAEFVMEIAGTAFAVRALFGSTRDYCRDYWTSREPEHFIAVTQDDLVTEQLLLDLEADAEGLKRRRFGGPFLERAVIQRRVAQVLLTRRTIMMHGSTVAVDGQAFLFTAACGTGKSTHTRLWREVFGPRAVMVNDDKPFLHVCDDGIFACGSPWTGKHGLGENVCLPLKGICVLRRGTRNVITPVHLNDVFAMLRHQCFAPEDADSRACAARLIGELADRVGLWQMECTKEPQAALVAFEAMSGYGRLP